MLENKGIKGLLLQGWDLKTKKPIQKLVILNGTIWKLATSEDYRDLIKSIEQKIIPKNMLNNTFGFITNFKNIFMVFKVKENKAGHLGARCDQRSKITVKEINEIIGTDKYNDTNIKKVSSIQLCVLQEYLLRLNDYNRKNGKRWFLTPAEIIITNTKDDKK